MNPRLYRKSAWILIFVMAVLLGGGSLLWSNRTPLPAPHAVDIVTVTDKIQATLQPRQRFGAGRSTQVRFDAQATLAAVATDIGLFLYTAASLDQRHFWATTTPVQSVAIATDGTAVAFSTSGEGPKLYRWQRATDELTVLDLEESLMHGLHYSPDGAYLVGISFYHLFIWDAATLAPLVSYQQPSALAKEARFSPDGALMALLYKETLELWRLTDHTLLQTVTLDEGHYFSPDTATFAPDGRQIAVAALREPLLYRWAVNQEAGHGEAGHNSAYLSPIQTIHVSTDAAAITDLHFSPDGQWLAVGATHGQLHRYALATDAPTTILPIVGLDKFAWNHASSSLAVAVDDGAIGLWSPTEPAQQQDLPLPPYARHSKVTQLFFTAADDAVIAVLDTGAIYYWRLPGGTFTQQLEQHSLGRLYSVAFTDEGSQLVIGAEHGIAQWWDVASSRPTLTRHPADGHIDAVAPAADGHFAIAASAVLALGVWADPVYLSNGSDDEPFTVLDTDDTGFVTSCGVYWNSAAFSPDGQYVATTAYAHKALLWRVADGALVQQFEGHTSAILDLAFSPDGTLLATASDDETVRLWHTADGSLAKTLNGHTGGAVAVLFAPDGQSLVTRSAVGDILRWPLIGDEPQPLLADVRNPRSNLAFSPDGAWLATGGRGNNVYLWPVADPMQLHVLTGHNGIVNAVAFSPDGTTLATAADDGTVLLWEVPPLNPE